MKNLPAKIWRNQEEVYRLMGARGTIITWTMVYAAPYQFEFQVPYPIALIRMDDGQIILSQITDYQEELLKTGSQVEAVFRKMTEPDKAGLIRYGIKFKILQ